MTETCINQFRNYLRSEEKAEATISKYLHDVKEMLVFIEKTDLNKDSLIEYRKYLTCRYKPQTVNGKLSAINAFLRFKDLLEFKVNFYSFFLIIRINTILSSTLKYRKTLILPRIYHD